MLGAFFLSRCCGLRANDAVEDRVGIACDEETTAGTEEDLITFVRLAVKSANVAGGAGGVDDLGVFAGFFEGCVGVLFFGFCGLGEMTVGSASTPCEAHIDATAVTRPPRPPRAERMSYFTS